MKPSEMIGKKFNNLTVIKYLGTRPTGNDGHKRSYVLCKCDCGKETVTLAQSVKNGNTKSCGCLLIEKARIPKVKTHGQSKTRLYNIWCGIKTRCYKKSNYHYKWYGARNIKMCDEWLNDFIAFQKWAISNGYNDNLTIDRINNDGNYEPNNCRWVDAKTQCNNRRKRCSNNDKGNS